MESNLVRIPDIKVFSFKDLHHATQCFAPKRWLGEGQHGRVYQGGLVIMPDRGLQAVAIKRFKPKAADPMYRILAELRVHKALAKHSSLPPTDLRQLLGVCFHITGPLLVLEFVSNGTLRQHLRRDARSSELMGSAMVRLSIAIDVAHALCELHYGFSLPIYYRNLKSSKILIEKDFHAKLADFGDAVIVKTDSDLLTPVAIGTVGYKDPVYEKTCWAGDKTDVYSFGVILMELVTHLPAWDPKRPTPQLADLVIGTMRGSRGRFGADREDTESVENIIQPGTQHGGMTLMKDLLYLAVQCCSLDLSCRPRIDEVHAALLQVQLQSIEMLLLCSGDELITDVAPTSPTPSCPEGNTTPWKP
jgi:serine/threonine protein kinase